MATTSTTTKQRLPGFAQLRQNNLDTLYGQNGVDKSAKGSVDAPIQRLVDIINGHDNYVTLSSCSGRMALYDPSANSPNTVGQDGLQPPQQPPNRQHRQQQASGKGGSGAWLFVSHDLVEDVLALQPFFDSSVTESNPQEDLSSLSSSKSPQPLLLFQFEPLLLHVGACHIAAGVRLLQIALQLGLRESGLVVTEQRVTVCIRTHGPSLRVPLSKQSHHALFPHPRQLDALIEEGNRRLARNLKLLQRLESAICDELFPQSLVSSSLPPLFLHSHAAVAIPQEHGLDSAAAVVLVVGGYGPGPILDENNDETMANVKTRSPGRSPHVYTLCRLDGSNCWDDHWRKLTVAKDDDETCPTRLLSFPGGSLSATAIAWEARRQGTTICHFASSPVDKNNDTIHYVLIYGGRKGPNTVFGDLEMLEYRPTCPCGSFYTINSVRGQRPSPRWGHTLTKVLCGKLIFAALLCGGRGTTAVCNDALYLLTAQPEDEPSDMHLLWTPLSLEGALPIDYRVFYHSAVALDDNRVFLFGGLSTVENVLESFAPSDGHGACSVLSLRPKTENIPLDVAAGTLTVAMDRVALDDNVTVRFGHAMCLLNATSKRSSDKHWQLCLSGGVSFVDDREEIDDDDPPFLILNLSQASASSYRLVVDDKDTHSLAALDAGLLVHHACVVSPRHSAPSEMLLVGGGVSGFAFSEGYSASHLLLRGTGVDVYAPQKHSATKQIDVHKRGVRQPSPHDVATAQHIQQVDVVYVHKRHAKELKTLLEANNLRNTMYRMTAVDLAGIQQESIVATGGDTGTDWNDCIAVPVVARAWDEEAPWATLVVGRGAQVCPQSTGAFARGKRT